MQFSINSLQVVKANLRGLMNIQIAVIVLYDTANFFNKKADPYSKGFGQCKRYRIN